VKRGESVKSEEWRVKGEESVKSEEWRVKFLCLEF
jgi:hypothetical protein